MTNGYNPAIATLPGGQLWHLHWQSTQNTEGKSSFAQSFSNCKKCLKQLSMSGSACQVNGFYCVLERGQESNKWIYIPLIDFVSYSWYPLSFTTFLGTGSVCTNASSSVFLLDSSFIIVLPKFPCVLSSLLDYQLFVGHRLCLSLPFFLSQLLEERLHKTVQLIFTGGKIDWYIDEF